MPVYEYKCSVCRKHFDIEQSFSEDSLTTLEGCKRDKSGQHQLKKVFSAVGISFKGDGFYKNDSRSGAKKASSNGSGTESDSPSSDSSKDSGGKEKASSSTTDSSTTSSDSSSGKSDSSSGKSESSTSTGTSKTKAKKS